jgi:hypothetical protein
MSRDMVFEDVPFLSRRQGDNVVASQNNSTILLGRDRDGSPDTGYGARTHAEGGKSSGAIHAIVGRVGENPDLWNDEATLYLSAKSDPDTQAQTGNVGSKQTAKSVAIVRADCIRMVPRADFKLSVGKAYLLMTSDGKVVIEGDVQLGEGASQRIIRGEAFAQEWLNHAHPTAVGLSGGPQPLSDNVFSSQNKVL